MPGTGQEEVSMPRTYNERWQTVESLAEGGQAHVFHVRDLRSPDDHYALKRLKNPERMERFEREIEVLRRLEHENIIDVIDSFVEGDTGCYVMPLMEGGNLRGRVESYKGDVQRSLGLVLAICDAVQAAHAAKIIHRDLKPENILFRRDGDDAPVVADFGICFLMGGQRFTSTTEAVGPRGFMAPELEGGKIDTVDGSCDVYSLGKLLYYIVSGGGLLPRERHREAGYELREMLTGDNLVSVASCQLEYVSRLLDRMLKENPSERWPNVEGCARQIRLVQRLVAEGRYPITRKMPCRFCGIGEYHLMSGPSGDRSRKERYMYCLHCGHFERFMVGVFEANDSLGGPPKGR